MTNDNTMYTVPVVEELRLTPHALASVCSIRTYVGSCNNFYVLVMCHMIILMEVCYITDKLESKVMVNLSSMRYIMSLT